MLGVALVILGMVALVYGGISYNRQKTVVEVGSFKVSATERKTIPVPAVVGAASLLGGVALLFAAKRRT